MYVEALLLTGWGDQLGVNLDACLHYLVESVEGLAAWLANHEEGVQSLPHLQLAQLPRLGPMQGLVHARQHALHVLLCCHNHGAASTVMAGPQIKNQKVVRVYSLQVICRDRPAS